MKNLLGGVRALWSKVTGASPPSVPPPAGPSLDELLVERFAAHFPGAVVNGPDVALPFAGLSVRCELGDLGRMGDQHSASIYFLISGGPFDNGGVFASVSGYGPNPLEAVVMGCCNWACAFGPVLRAGVAGEPPEVASFEAVADGQRFQVFVEHLDRAVRLEGSTSTPDSVTREARLRLGQDGWMLRRVLASGTLPLLRSDRPVLLSAFTFEVKPPRTVEVKVNGGDWVPSHAPLLALPYGGGGDVPMLRELAVAVPLDPAPPLRREAIKRTLAGLATAPAAAPRRMPSWRGYRAHGGRLGDPLSPDALERLRRDTPGLPEDYLAFLRDIESQGAAPGYGLLSPLHAAQAALLQRSDTPGRALALAHGGCGVMWLLALDGERRGEVWVDARCVDGTLCRVDATFSDWYRRWLDAAARDVFPAIDWDSDACATSNLLAEGFDRLERDGVPPAEQAARLASMIRSISLKAAGSECFLHEDPIDPCAGCSALAQRFGLKDAVFSAGLPPLQGR